MCIDTYSNITPYRACPEFSSLRQKTLVLEHCSAAYMRVCEQRRAKKQRFMAKIGNYGQALVNDTSHLVNRNVVPSKWQKFMEGEFGSEFDSGNTWETELIHDGSNLENDFAQLERFENVVEGMMAPMMSVGSELNSSYNLVTHGLNETVNWLDEEDYNTQQDMEAPFKGVVDLVEWMGNQQTASKFMNSSNSSMKRWAQNQMNESGQEEEDFVDNTAKNLVAPFKFMGDVQGTQLFVNSTNPQMQKWALNNEMRLSDTFGNVLTNPKTFANVSTSLFFGGFKGGLTEDTENLGNMRLISSMERVSSNEINKGFITEKSIAEGWKPPYPGNIGIRKITTAQELKFYRVHTDVHDPFGRFLAREKEIAPFLNDPEALRLHLGLPNKPIYITEVNVPKGTALYVGRIGPQPTFGLDEESGFQYQVPLENQLPKTSYTNTQSILQQRYQYKFNF